MTVDILPLPDREDLEIATFNQFVGVVELFFVFSAIVADAVVVWRTWAVYAGRLTAIAAPCLLLLAAFVFALVDVTLSLDKGADSPLPGADIMYTKSQILVWALSLATNVLCTVLIGIRAWRHRRTMKELSLGVKYPGLSTDRILSLLVESGFIYSFLWAAQVVGYLDFSADSPWNYISQVVVRIGRQLTGLYPTLIIVLVNFGHTIWESEGYHTEALGRDRKMGSLRWAPMTTTTTSSVPTRRGKHDELGIGLESVMSRGDADEARGAEDG
ncbi:hypothetical protein FB45DRAFT_939625 [Roridomyces roridus]|uniref:Uncharacterized protein n=1 Tax=Roridomyces roridus TaxID=1738132 RepID=A0AAD7B852_9AGAR|nr:hypothetical protein FB45DRAFT_939625 [Roridomyces roridus]